MFNRCIVVVLFFLSILFSDQSFGQSTGDSPKEQAPVLKVNKQNRRKAKKQAPPPPTPKKTIETRILKATDSVAESVDKTAEKVDLLLAGKKYTKKKNTSSVTFRQFATYQDGQGLKTPTDFGLNIRLPNVEKRWQLRFSSYDEEQDRRNLQQQRVRTTAPPKDYGAGLLFFEKLGNIKTSFQPRLQLKDPLEMIYTLRFENEAEWKPVMRLNSRVELFADPKKGTGEFASIEMRFELAPRLDLGFQNTEEYHERDNFFITQHGLSLDYSLSKTRALGTGFNVSNNNKTKYHLDSYTYSVVIAEQIYADRLLLSLTPFVAFAKGAGFQGKSGVTLQAYVKF